VGRGPRRAPHATNPRQAGASQAANWSIPNRTDARSHASVAEVMATQPTRPREWINLTAERNRIEPADRVVTEAVLGRRSDDERARIAAEAQALFAAARARAERIEASTTKLVPLVLAWAMAVDASELTVDQDPGAPLVELYRAGFQLAYTSAGIEVHHATGWMIAPVPSRASLA
jgi:hypothetical protein